MILKAAVLPLVATMTVHPLANEEVLEPSVLNEVDHALARAPATNPAPASVSLPFATNGLSRTALVIRLVSMQGQDGRWRSGTNDVTAVAVEILKTCESGDFQ